jgi:hypothetical protein
MPIHEFRFASGGVLILLAMFILQLSAGVASELGQSIAFLISFVPVGLIIGFFGFFLIADSLSKKERAQ